MNYEEYFLKNKSSSLFSLSTHFVFRFVKIIAAGFGQCIFFLKLKDFQRIMAIERDYKQ